MSWPCLAEVAGAQFSAEAHTEENRVLLRLSGSADGANKPDLDRVIAAISAESAAHKISEVAVDLKTLEFMDSSCIKSFVTWISSLQDLPEGERYPIRFICDPAAHWQRRSMHALSLFGEELVLVEI